MFRLRSIGVLSCAKIFAVIQAVIGVLFGLFFFLLGLVGAAIVPSQQKLGMIGIVVISVLIPAFYGVLGFVMGAIWAYVYNFAAQFIGGLELQLDEKSRSYLAPPPVVGAWTLFRSSWPSKAPDCPHSTGISIRR
jgi:hypothetical protein